MNDPTVIVKGRRAVPLAYNSMQTRWAKFRFIFNLILVPLKIPAFVFHELCHVVMMALCGATYFTYKINFMEYAAFRACDVESKREILVDERYTHYSLTIAMLDFECPLRSFLIAFAPFFGYILLLVTMFLTILHSDSVLPNVIYMYVVWFPLTFMPSLVDYNTGRHALALLIGIRKLYPNFIAFLSSFRKVDNQNVSLYCESISKTSHADQKCHKL